MAYNAIGQMELHSPSDSELSGIQSPFIGHDPHKSPSQPLSPNQSRHSPGSDTMEQPRTVSRHGSTSLQHPTPDLQSIQGAYVGNIERLEESAGRLSMSSDIGEELRKMKLEQKRSESRRSSIMNSQTDERLPSPPLRRQVSYGYGSHASSSIVGTNAAARSGGFSPAAYFASPRSSVRSGSRSHHNSVKERSMSQGARLTQVTEPQQEGKPLDSPLSMRCANLVPQPESPTRALQVVNHGQEYNLNDVEIPLSQDLDPEPDHAERELLPVDDMQDPRPSTDTARQANGLFLDFDGVHTVANPAEPSIEQAPLNRRRSSHLLGRPQSFLEPTPGENMVYYPAPVPMMLNLPKRLSRLPAAPQRDKRRSEMLGGLPADARKSAAWLPDMDGIVGEEQIPTEDDLPPPPREQKRRTMADLPPQLRASMFFDYPAVRQDVEVKGESAVATLDSILDASAFAPVSAFTDHPIVGRAGAEIYGKAPVSRRADRASTQPLEPQKRRSTINLLTKRSSSADLLDDSKKRNSSTMSLGNPFSRRKSNAQQFEDAEEYHKIDKADINREEAPLQHPDAAEFDVQNDFHDAEDVDEQPEDENEATELSGQPTTLLAELQLRKQQQKSRNRTAATAFPDGMHSTLLQLDAVAHVQKQSRRQKHTTLAWEDPDVHRLGPENEDDEETPLGMLYPGRKTEFRRYDEDRPPGLIAQRAMEDNEPLSHRRARLRGEDVSLRDQSLDNRNSIYPPDFASPLDENDDDDDPNETLAQRIKRLKATQIPTSHRPVSTDFSSELMSQFGGISPAAEPQPTDPAATTANAVEADQEEETLAQCRARLQAQSQSQSQPRNTSNPTQPRPTMTTRRSMADILTAHPAAGAGVRTLSNELKFAPAPKTRNTPWAQHMNRQAGLGQVPMAAGVGVPPRGHNGGGGQVHLIVQGRGVEAGDGRRDMIDRWRQSVLY